MGRMANVRCAKRGLGESAAGQYATSSRQRAGEGQSGFDLGPRGSPVRRRCTGMRGDDVPAEDVLLEPELLEGGTDDRRGRLGRAGAGQLPFGCEGDPGDTGAAVAGGLADEQDRRVAPLVQIARQPFTEMRRFGVLVVGPANPSGGEPIYQRSQWTLSSSRRRRCDIRLDFAAHSLSSAGRPTVMQQAISTSSGNSSS